jgi:hypothetical protein
LKKDEAEHICKLSSTLAISEMDDLFGKASGVSPLVMSTGVEALRSSAETQRRHLYAQ